MANKFCDKVAKLLENKWKKEGKLFIKDEWYTYNKIFFSSWGNKFYYIIEDIIKSAQVGISGFPAIYDMKLIEDKDVINGIWPLLTDDERSAIICDVLSKKG